MSKVDRKSIVLFALFVICSILNSQQIYQITDINLDYTVVDYSSYLGSIKNYENRIYVESGAMIEELFLYNDGSLERLSLHQQGNRNIYIPSIIDDGRLYSFYYLNESRYIQVFDITTTPMSHVATVEFPNSYPNNETTRQGVWENYILIPGEVMIDGILTSVIHKFNKDTLAFETYIDTFGMFAIKDNIIIGLWWDGTQFSFRFHDLRSFIENPNYEDTFLYEITLEQHEWSSLIHFRVEGNHLYYISPSYVVIYDISDFENITMVASFLNQSSYDSKRFADVALYNGMAVINRPNGIYLYDISDPENPFQLLMHETAHNEYRHIME